MLCDKEGCKNKAEIFYLAYYIETIYSVNKRCDDHTLLEKGFKEYGNNGLILKEIDEEKYEKYSTLL